MRRVCAAHVARIASLSNRWLDVTFETRDQGIVIGVRTDPEPDHLLAGSHTDRTPSQTDANGVDRLGRVDGLEAKTGVTGILSPKPVGDSGALLDFSRKVTIRLPEGVSGL